MKRCNWLSLALLALPVVLAPSIRAETRVGGDITGNVQWTRAGSPYVVTADITVKPGARLSVGPGVLVRFKPNLADQKGVRPFDLEIAVYGTLECQGADNDSVYFTSDAIEAERQDWAGVIGMNGAKLRIDRTIFDCATTAITVQDNSELDLMHSRIRFCSERGVHFMRSRGRLVENYITNIGNFSTTGKGVLLVESPDVLLEGNIIESQTALALERGSDARVVRNTLANCRLYGLSITSSSPKVNGNSITNNYTGVLIRGRSRPELRDNNIFANANWELQVKEYRGETAGRLDEFDFSGNWWGPITIDAAYDRIEDGTDDPAAGASVRLEPVLKEPYRAR